MYRKLPLLFAAALFLVLSGCRGGGEEAGAGFEVIAKSRSVPVQEFQNGAELIHDEDMLMTSIEETGADIRLEDVDFEEALLFEVSIMENGCGFTLTSVEEDDGVLKFNFELTPVAEGEAEPGEVVCTEIAVPAVFYVKTGPADFHSLEVYGSGMKYE
ncbi:hypothetical protein [Salinicoccus halitifaciens]|uniref:Lipoprotein n=1 Tax=Salinicoccus halitifaciens TaxID=1073415 RepID=A0ABV2ECV9_9STAP|nr:hypothetical protein [Salinicoccus halitifaciens]MCD2138656.1 hypothetical protein [Salinicoccus halitifaciens]